MWVILATVSFLLYLFLFSLDEFLFSPSLIDAADSLITWGGWLDDVLMYNEESLGFLYDLCAPFARIKVTSKKLTILRCVWISILKRTSLKIFISFLHVPFFAPPHCVIKLSHHRGIIQSYFY